jgi:hypothetical protein
MKDGILMGTNVLNGQPVYLSDKDRASHLHIIGTTGAGKSKLMEHMIRSDIDSGKGLCLIDPHGDLYKNILSYVVRKRLDNRAILMDPNDEDWSVGLNYLDYDPRLRSSTSHASKVMDGISKVFGGEDMDVAPRLQRWSRNSLIALIERKLTLIELSDFVNPESSTIRAIILREVTNAQVLHEWEMFDKIPFRERVSYVESILNRANKFATGENIRRIFGQVKSTIDFRQAMDEGKIILCNLACNKLSIEEQKMLGIVIVDKVVQAGMSRVDIPEHRRRPFYFYLDEFGQFVSDDIARALQELRKFRVTLILAHQELEQLRDESRKVYSAVISEPQARVSFRISREDAEILAKEMFTGQIRGDKEKRRIEQTKFRPVESTRVIDTDSDSFAAIESETVQGLSLNTTSGTGYTYGGGHTRTVTPFYEQHPFREVSSIEDYSIEEIVEKYIAWIKAQPDRHAQVKIGQNPPIPVETPYVGPVPVREKDVQALKEKVYSQYALPAGEADMMIEERRTKFLEEAKALELGEKKETVLELTPQSMRHKS